MENSASSPHSHGNLSPLRVSGASAHGAMQNAAPEAPVINLASSDDASINTEDHVTTTVDPTNQSPNQLLQAPTLPPLPLPSNDPEPLPSDDPETSSHGDCSDDDYVPPSKSPKGIYTPTDDIVRPQRLCCITLMILEWVIT